MRGGIIVLRDRGEVNGVPIPSLPGAWSVQVQGRTGWVHLFNAQGREFLWLTAIDGPDVGYPTKIVGCVFPVAASGAAFLKAFALDNDRAWTIKELRADNGTQATAIKVAWRMYREGGSEPVVNRTVAGFSFDVDAETYGTVDGMPD